MFASNGESVTYPKILSYYIYGDSKPTILFDGFSEELDKNQIIFDNFGGKLIFKNSSEK